MGLGWGHRKPPPGWPVKVKHPLVPTVGFLGNEQGGTILKNLSSRGNDLVITNGSWEPQLFFNETTYAQNLNGISGIDGSELTVVTRVRPDNMNESKNVAIFELSDGTTGERVVFYAGGGASQHLYLFSPDDSNYWDENSNPLVSGAEYDLAVTFDYGSPSKVFIDGAGHTPDASGNLTAQTGLDSILIGAFDPGTPEGFLEGLLDFFYVYPRILMDSEIFDLHLNPFCWVRDPFSIEFMTYVAAGGVEIFRRRIEGY